MQPRRRRQGLARAGYTAFARLCVVAALCAGVLAGAVALAWDSREDSEARAARVRYMLPSVSLAEFMEAGTDSVMIWAGKHAANAGNRAVLFEGVRELVAQHDRFMDRVSPIYPRNQLEWMLITDAVADTLVRNLFPILEAYQKAHPREELGLGRQAFELEILHGLTAPPSRMLGFLVLTMARFAYTRADSLFATGVLMDHAGVQDGLLRNLRDWSSEFMQVHSDPISVYESRMVQQDWIIARLEDRCGNSGGGTWMLGEQYMAVVDRDTTVTPHVEMFAHEIHLKAVKCEGDDRVLWIDLPNFREVQLEVYRRSLEEQENRGAGTR